MKKIFVFIAALMALSSCTNENEKVDSPTIRVEAVFPSSSRATATAFEAGDVMSLYAVAYEGGTVPGLQMSGNYLNNEPMTYNGSTWNSDRTLYWNTNACDFYAFYPYQQVATMEGDLFHLATDQTTDGYEQNDILWAKAEKIAQSDGVVKLQFNHMMSHLVVNIERGEDFEGDLPEDIEVHIYNTATTALVNWNRGTLEKYPLSDNNTISMRQIDSDTFDAIVVPQFIQRSTPLIEITMEGIAYLLEYSMSFRPGYQHTVTVTLNTSPDQEKIEISIDGEVSDWN